MEKSTKRICFYIYVIQINCRIQQNCFPKLQYIFKGMQIIRIQPLRELVKPIIACPSILTRHLKQVSCSLGRDLQSKYPSHIIAVAVSVNQRESAHRWKHQQIANTASTTWLFNEHKVFSWSMIYISITENIQFLDLTDLHFQRLQTIFITKSLQFIKYSCRVFFYQKHGPTQAWSNDEIQQLLLSMQGHKASDTLWKDVAYDLFVASGGRYFRTISQCREKWNNHLNPETKKEKWTLEEDLQLFQLVSMHGRKWAQIAKYSQFNRTEHMVKNRYNFYFRKRINSKKDVQGIISGIKRRLRARKNYCKKEEEKLVSSRPQNDEQFLKNCIQNHSQPPQNEVEIKLQEQIKEVEQVEIKLAPQVLIKEEQSNRYLYRQNISTSGHKLEVKQEEDIMKKNIDLFYYPFMQMGVFPPCLS